jgi:hypothetical protein
LIPNPIRKVLSTMAKSRVRALLMGGQACVFYGAAEFSRDTDLAILAEPENLECLRAALEHLQADRIAVPPFEMDYLRRGHAIHFRCRDLEAAGMRVDIMSVMRGVDSFTQLWERRVTVEDAAAETQYELLCISDLVQAKKTQRERDWPMIRRLVEADYLSGRARAEPQQISFWLRELRTPELLIELAGREPEFLRQSLEHRALLAHAMNGDPHALAESLEAEEKLERERDRIYWRPLKAELEQLRHKRA